MDMEHARLARRSQARGRKRKRECCANILLADTKRQHFDALPDSALENILRYLSPKPRVSDWAHFVPAASRKSVLLAGGSLGVASSDVFPALQLERCENPLRCHNGVIIAGSGTMLGPRWNLALSRVGGFLKKLVVNRSMLTRANATAIATHCTALRHLNLHAYDRGAIVQLPIVLEACGPRLEVLEFEGHDLTDAQVKSIAKNCGRLRRLSILCWKIDASLAPVWTAVGTSLRDLEFELHPNVMRDSKVLAVPVLSQECQSISLLALKFHEHTRETMLEALQVAEAVSVRCGARLLQLKLLTWPLQGAQVLQRISSASPNAYVDVLDEE